MDNSAEAVEVLVQFRAGRMVMAGTTVKPDPRKGLLRMIRADDMLVHLQWLDRSTGAVEEDVIIFPEEATFAKVGQAKGRVYLLSFAGDGRKLFFWMQEPNAEDDERLCALVNQRLNEVLWIEDDTDDDDDHMEGDDDDGDEEEGLEVEEEEGGGKPETTSAVAVPQAVAAAAPPPSAAQPSSTERQTQGAPQPPAATTQPKPAASPAAAAPSRLGSAGAAAAAPPPVRQPANSVPAAAASPFGSLNISAAEAAAALAASLQMGQLRNLVSGLSQIAVPAEVAAAAKAAKEPSLSELLRPASMVEVLQAHDVQERLRDLLPPALQSATEMQQLVKSPQFQQQLDTLSLLLRTGRIDLAQFGINSARYGPGVVSFLEAIQDQVPAAAPAAPPAQSATPAATPPAPGATALGATAPGATAAGATAAGATAAGATATDQTTMDVDETVNAATAEAPGAAAGTAAAAAAAGGRSDVAQRVEAGVPAAPQDGKAQHRVESKPDGPPDSGT